MTNHENTQHQPNTGETPQSQHNRLITTLRGLGAKSLEHTRQTLHTARMIHRHGLPLPPYREEGQPATSGEMKVLNDVLSTVAAQTETAAAPTHTATAHDSIDPLHHEAVLTHENDTQDDAPSPKTHIYSDGKLIKPQTFSQLYTRILRQKPKTDQRNTIASPED